MSPERAQTGLRRIEITPQTFLWAALTVALCWVGLRLLPVILVVVMALFLVGTLNPAVDWLEARGIGRVKAIALVFTALLVGAGLLGALTLPPLVEQLQALAKMEPELRGRLAEWLGRSHITARLADSLKEVNYQALAKSFAGTALAWSTRAVEIVAYLLSAVFLALYMMIDRDRLRGGLYAAVPRRFHIRLSRVLLNLETIVGGYIRGQLLTSALMAVFVGVLLSVCGVPNAIALAVFGGIADVLPYIGVFLTVGPAVLAASSKGLVTAIVVAALLLAYEEFESRFLVPHIYGKVLRLPSSIVLIALLVGASLLGILGALLALPAAAAIRMLFEELRVALPGENAEDENVRARDEQAESEYRQRAQGVPAEAAAAIALEISDAQRAEAGGPLAAVENKMGLDKDARDSAQPPH
ncbi:MAG: AI-2E family transporter [Polyangiaceae bacterium]